jgi:hypothetical protein
LALATVTVAWRPLLNGKAGISFATTPPSGIYPPVKDPRLTPLYRSSRGVKPIPTWEVMVITMPLNEEAERHMQQDVENNPDIYEAAAATPDDDEE